jgi:uncharacterized membrane protein YkoI
MKLIRTVLVMSWLCAAGSAALAAGPAPHPAVSMAQAVKMVEQRYHASVAKAETQHEGARTLYVMRVYNKSTGKVFNVRVDAASGAIL